MRPGPEIRFIPRPWPRLAKVGRTRPLACIQPPPPPSHSIKFTPGNATLPVRGHIPRKPSTDQSVLDQNCGCKRARDHISVSELENVPVGRVRCQISRLLDNPPAGTVSHPPLTPVPKKLRKCPKISKPALDHRPPEFWTEPTVNKVINNPKQVVMHGRAYAVMTAGC